MLAVQLEPFSADIVKMQLGDLPASSAGTYILSPAEAKRLSDALFYWFAEIKIHGSPPKQILVDDNNCAHIQRGEELPDAV